MINYDTLFDDENKDILAKLEAESAGVLGRLDNKEGFGNTGIEALRTSKSFEEISQQKWNAFNFGNGGGNDEPQFPQPCEALPFEDDFYKGGINYYKIVQYIKTQYNEIFDSTNFEGIAVNNTSTTPSSTTGIPITSYYTTIENVPFAYSDNIGNSVVTNLSGRLNTRKCFLELKGPNLQWGWWFNLDSKNKNIALGIEYYYKDTYNKKRNALSTPQLNDYTIEDKFKAIIITTSNINDFVGLINDIYGKDISKAREHEIIQKFVVALSICTDPLELNFLYSNMPNFVIEDIKKYADISTETLWAHLNILSTYRDNAGWLRIFKGGSGAIITILKCIGDIKTLYTKFLANPALIRTIYYGLNGSSEIEELGVDKKGNLVTTVTKSNKIIFSTFLSELCKSNTYKGLAQPTKTFYHGTLYTQDANVKAGNEGDDSFFIQQTKEVPLQGMDFTPFTETITDDEGALYKPLELVFWKDTASKKEADATIMVPAIFIKAFSDEAEWEEIQLNIRLGLDVLMAVAGIATLLTTGNPFMFALAVADIGLATSDIAINTFRKEIEELGGKEFLDTWEKIYLVGTLATATPAAIGSLFKFGNALIKAAVFVNNGGVRNFVTAVLFRIMLDRNIANFTKGTLKNIITGYDAVRGANVVFKFAGIERLEKAGVAIFKLVSSEGEEIYIAYYKDQIIAKGAAKEFRDALKNIWDARNAELLEKLNAILNRRRIVTVRDASLVGQAPKVGSKMLFDLIDEFGNFMGQLTRLPNGKNLIYKLVYEGKELDINCFVQLLDKPVKDIPVYKGENILFADFNIPKAVTDKISGLGQIMLDDGLAYFNRSRNYGNVDGTLHIWAKTESYAEYGGQSINLEQFWKAVDKGKGKVSYEEAAFETFSGKWAKKSGFTKVRIRNADDVSRESVMLNFLKEQL